MSQLKAFFSYKKFKTDSLRILYLNNQYFLQNESIGALRRLGHTVLDLAVQGGPEQMLETILKAAVELKPDCVMGTNHMGLDPEGKIAAILNDFEIPVLFWYLDDFRFIIREAHKQAFPNIAIFTFEQTDLPLLRKFGFEHCFYLPAASALDPGQRFYSDRYRFLSGRVSFVGNTFYDALKRWNHPRYPELYDQLRLKRWQPGRESLVSFILRTQREEFESEAQLYHYAGYVAGRSTAERRAEYLNVLERPVIFGDEYWPETGVRAEIYPPVHPYKTAPLIYNASAVNVNISSTQLHTSVNQRIFDVPLSGGFLLTDWKESLAELFDERSELAVFRSKQEMVEKARYFLQHPAERAAIAHKAAERVLKDHLLLPRIEQMLKLARSVFSV